MATSDGIIYVSTAQELWDALQSPDALGNANYHVELTANINLDDLGNVDGNGSNWIAVGDIDNHFQGTFNGNGYTISNLKINSNNNFQGFFGRVYNGAIIQNVNLENVQIESTGEAIGSLAGANLMYATISNCHASGTVSGGSRVGGLVGSNGGTISLSSSSVTVVGSDSYTGGLVGACDGGISGSWASGDVIGGSGSYTGGLLGGVTTAKLSYSIRDSYATGLVTGTGIVGGLAGNVGKGGNQSITNSYFSSSSPDNGLGEAKDESWFTPENTTAVLNGINPDEPTTPTDPTDPVDPTPTDPVDPNPTDPTDPVDPTPTDPVDPNPTDPTDPVDPTPTDPTDPVDPTPTDPVDPDPTDPDTPDTPTTPTTPTIPTAPTIPTGATIFQIGTEANSLNIHAVDTTFSIDDLAFDIMTQDSARNMLNKCDDIILKINKKRADIGASTNILNSIYDGNSLTQINLSASNSRIIDADIAKESSNLVKAQILQSATASLLSQTQSLSGSLLLGLLRG